MVQILNLSFIFFPIYNNNFGWVWFSYVYLCTILYTVNYRTFWKTTPLVITFITFITINNILSLKCVETCTFIRSSKRELRIPGIDTFVKTKAAYFSLNASWTQYSFIIYSSIGHLIINDVLLSIIMGILIFWELQTAIFMI